MHKHLEKHHHTEDLIIIPQILPNLMSKQKNDYQSPKFDNFQIVWAKINGYPWWPAIITNVPCEKDNSQINDELKNQKSLTQKSPNSSDQYRVDFIADQTHALLKKCLLQKYKPNRQRLVIEGRQFSRRKTRFFQMALKQADQLIQVLKLSKNQLKQQANDEQSQKSQQIQKEQSDQSENQKQFHIKQTNEIPQSVKTKKIQKKVYQNKSSSKFEQKQSFVPKKRYSTDRKLSQTTLIQTFITKPFNNKINKQTKNNSRIQIKNSIIQIKNSRTQIKKRGRPFKNIISKEIYNLNNKFSNLIEQKIQQQNSDQNAQQQQQELLIQGKNMYQINKNVQNLLHQKNKQLQMTQILTKYKLNRIDQLQQQMKIQKKYKKIQQLFTKSLQSQFNQAKTSKNMSFIKNTSKNKSSNIKQTSYLQKQLFNQSILALSKMKISDQQKSLSTQRKQFLISYCLKSLAKKIYKIVENLINKNHPNNQSEIICFDEIKIRSLQLAKSIFIQQNNQEQLNQSFFNALKLKIDESIKFIRLFSLENWYLLTKNDTFSTQTCVFVSNLQQLLQKKCHLNMKNEEKYQDILKHIGTQNQKTSFNYTQPPFYTENQSHYIYSIQKSLIITSLEQQITIDK